MREKTGDNIRAFKIVHQFLKITSIDFEEERLQGVTELTVVPHSDKLRVIRLNAKQIQIQQVVLEGSNEVQYQCLDPFADVTKENKSNQALDTFNICHLAATLQVDPDNGAGELVLPVPEDASGLIASGIPIKLKIQFALHRPTSGISFVVPPGDGDYKERGVHMFTFGHQNSSRLWFPCVDSYAEPCTWNIEITVPKDMTAVSNGDLQQTVMTHDMQHKTFYYALTVPTCAPNISLAVGCFEIFVDPKRHEVTHFALPNLAALLRTSVHHVHQIFEFYEEIFTISFPYSCYKLVFVDRTVEWHKSFASMSILSVNLLHNATIIDQVYITRRTLALAIAEQYFGCFISMQNWSDIWLTQGISRFLAALYCKNCFGNNMYMDNVNEIHSQVLAYEEKFGGIILDSSKPPASGTVVMNMPKIPFYFPTKNLHTQSSFYSEALAKKAFLVIRMLSIEISVDAVLTICGKFLSAAETTAKEIDAGCLSSMLISTDMFLQTIVSVTNKPEHSVFFDNWVHANGHLHFRVNSSFTRGKNTLDLEIIQEFASRRGFRLYKGSVPIAVQEIDGYFLQNVSVDGVVTRVQVPLHTKASRKKKKVTLLTMEEVDIDMEKMDESPVLWFRVDPELSLLRTVVIGNLPDFKWIYKLHYGRDILAQMDALKALEGFPCPMTKLALDEIFENEETYFRVRCNAAFAIAKICNKMPNFYAPPSMITLFNKMFGSARNEHIVRNNQFDNFQHYYLQRAFPCAIAGLRDMQGVCPKDVVDFLLRLVRLNNNSRNRYSDNYYRASLVEALGETVTPSTSSVAPGSEVSANYLPGNVKVVVKQIGLWFNLDQCAPCYKYTVSVACLKAIRKIQKLGLLPNTRALFRSYTEPGIFLDLRLAAIECFIDTLPLATTLSDTLGYLLDLVENDQDQCVRHNTLRMLVENPPFEKGAAHALDVPELRERIWTLMNSKMKNDSLTRCDLVDLYFQLYGARQHLAMAVDTEEMRKDDDYNAIAAGESKDDITETTDPAQDLNQQTSAADRNYRLPSWSTAPLPLAVRVLRAARARSAGLRAARRPPLPSPSPSPPSSPSIRGRGRGRGRGGSRGRGGGRGRGESRGRRQSGPRTRGRRGRQPAEGPTAGPAAGIPAETAGQN